MLSDIRDLTKVLGHEKYQNRTHTLSGTVADVLQRLRQKPVGMRQRLVEKIDEIAQF